MDADDYADIQVPEEQAKHDLGVIEEQRKQQGITGQPPRTLSLSNINYAWLLNHNHARLDPRNGALPSPSSTLEASRQLGWKPDLAIDPGTSGLLLAYSSLYRVSRSAN